MQRNLRTVYLLTFLTGSAGLIYQVVWQRYLTRLLGSDGLATATVLGVFLGGLALGYLICGALTMRTRRVFVAYGILEAAIGLWALSFPWLFAAVDRLTGSWNFEPTTGLVVQGTLCALFLLLPPTICMGGTVPMLTRGLSRSLEDATAAHARIYAVNTAGAAFGTLLAGFVLIQQFGLPGSLRIGALINLCAAGFFILRGRQLLDEPPASDAGAVVSPPPSWALFGIVFLSGFAFLTLETVLVRVTHLTFGGSSYNFAIVVAVFVIAIAFGAHRVARRGQPGEDALVRNHLGICIGLAVLFVTLDLWPWAGHLLRTSFGSSTAAMVGFYATIGVLLLVVLGIPAALMGATVPLAYAALRKQLDDVGLRAGWLLSANALGNLLGGLLGGFLLFRWFDLGQLFVLALGLVAAGACLSAARLPSRGRRTAAAAVAVALICAIWFPYDPTRMAVGTFRLRERLPFAGASPDAFYLEFYRHRNLLAYTDAPEATIAVVENPRPAEALLAQMPTLAAALIEEPEQLPLNAPRPRSILVNGKPDSSTFYDRETLRLSAHLPALLAEDRSSVLVIGLGTGVTAGELSLYPDVKRIDVAEISGAVVDFLPFFSDATHEVEDDPRLQIQVGDAFRVIRRGQRSWNLIISEPSNPWVTGVDQVFSREFYRLVREHLEADGIFVQWLQRYATNDDVRRLVLRTLLVEFPYIRLFHAREAADDLIVASLSPIPDTRFDRIADQLLRFDAVRESLAEIGIDGPIDFRGREDANLFDWLGGNGAGPIETLDRPRLHYLSGTAFFRGDHIDH